jgi:hypothetical protein
MRIIISVLTVNHRHRYAASDQIFPLAIGT